MAANRNINDGVLVPMDDENKPTLTKEVLDIYFSFGVGTENDRGEIILPKENLTPENIQYNLAFFLLNNIFKNIQDEYYKLNHSRSELNKVALYQNSVEQGNFNTLNLAYRKLYLDIFSEGGHLESNDTFRDLLARRLCRSFAITDADIDAAAEKYRQQKTLFFLSKYSDNTAKFLAMRDLLDSKVGRPVANHKEDHFSFKTLTLFDMNFKPLAQKNPEQTAAPASPTSAPGGNK